MNPSEEEIVEYNIDPEPYKSVIRILKDGIDMAEKRRAHKCDWDENGFCLICGRDGNS